MGCGNPPSVTAPKEEQDKFSLTTKPIGADGGGRTHGANSFGADIMNFPFMSLGYTHFAQHEGDCRSYPECENGNNRLGAYMNLNCLNYKVDANLMSVRSDISEFHKESAMWYPDSSTSGLCHATDRNNAIESDSLMNTAVSSMDSHKTADHMNFMPQRCEATTGYPIKAHGTEAKKIKISGSQMRGKYSSSECNSSVLPLVDNFPVTGNKVDLNIVPLPFSSPQNVDGKFLTLGIGGGTEIRSNSNFSSREIASKLEDAVSSQCNSSLGGQSPMNPSSLAHLTGRAARIQTKAGRLSSSASNLGGRMSTSYGGGAIGDTSTRLNSMPFPSLQTPQATPQFNFPAKHDTSVFDLTPSSLPFRSTLISQPESVTMRPEITKFTDFASQSVPRQQDHGRSSINVSCESSRNYLYDRHRGSSISHAQLGELIPLTKGGGTESGAGISLPGSVQPVGQVIPVAKLDVRPQVSPFVSHPSLKRQATENSPDARLGQRRKFFPRPIIHHSVAHQRQISPAIPASIPATVHIPPVPLHVKWQGFDAPLEPTGHKCLLCKRNLSFTAEGPVYQAAIPPAVAVLPCGHTFHDQCLQVITPEDQAKSPPCIPCAIGET
ncbi:UNVERIFIED_CONTAM: hypothetical protein Slati_3377500 [Sesamum latifolium]|uniref:RING-type domain-containing protein n=1 Tax=Sesamum latifolium TaxID=2727402 RepID=A0AAW2UHM2_9LAMI